MATIGETQKKTLIDAKLFLKRFHNAKFYPEKNNNFYLSSFTNCIGLIKIRKFLKVRENFFKKNYIILKDIFYSSYYMNYYCQKFESKLNFNQIIVSWANKKNFNKSFGICLN